MNKLLYIFLGILMVSCSGYPGYKKLNSRIYYSLKQLGESRKKPVAGDYITVSLEYRSVSDSVFFTGKRKIKLSPPQSKSSVSNCFLALEQGDSASFIIPAADFFHNTLKRSLPGFLNENDPMIINVRLIDIQSESEFQKEKKLFLTWSAELSEFENLTLQQFLKEEKIKAGREDGFYMITLKKGNERKVQAGDHIWVHYEGKFLDGKFFDGTYRSHEPVDFIYGTQFVLIDGLEKALSKMTEGEKAMVILPSDLAFGEKGDDSGIIPPYTSLIYILEVIKIE